MAERWKRMFAVLAAAVLAGAVLSGCSAGGGDVPEAGGDSGQAPSAEVFRPADLGAKSNMGLSFPYLGLKVDLPAELGARMDRGEVMCQASEHIDGGEIEYAFLWWDVVPVQSRDTELPMDERAGEALQEWFAELERVGTIGVFREDLEERLSEITGGGNHTVLGKQGGYLYVLSLRDGGDPEIGEELRQAEVEISEMVPFDGESAFDAPRTEVTELGEFTAASIAGETVTQEIFQGHRLTLVNIFATWCTPCIQEIPELDQLSREMAERGVQVVGVVLDTVDAAGNPDPEALSKAALLKERTGASYLFMTPDPTMMNGRLAGVAAVPETFFVDGSGRIVGETYVGARDLDAWTGIVEAELAALEGGS